MTRIAGVIHNSVVDGPGMRTVVFFSGCRRLCPFCHNTQAQDFGYGEEIGHTEAEQIIKDAIENGDSGLTLSGGHPLEPENYEMATYLATKAKEQELSVWLYTGYVFEQIPIMYMDLVSIVDVLVDGPFIEKLKSLDCPFRGSTNQKLIDIQKTFEKGKIVLWTTK